MSEGTLLGAAGLLTEEERLRFLVRFARAGAPEARRPGATRP